MNFQNLNTLICQEQSIQKHDIKLLEILKWDEIKKKLVKITIEITFTQDNKIVYSQEGVILRIEQVNDSIENQELLTNMEQIKYAQWQGEYGENNRKNGYWRVIWRGKPLRRVGGYYQNGLKQGIWNELNKNFWILAQIQERGQYFKGQKNGEWIYFFDDKKIGGGSYNQSGQKNGKWIELGDGFYNHSQVTYEGEYKNGKKIGLWDIWFKKHIVGKQNYMIGGGSYDQEDQNKIGKWIELSDGFQEFCQVTCSGEYQIGKRIGQWSIWYKYWETNNYKEIGGGFYDEEGSMKIGRWIELSDEFKCDLQITINGEYNNGKRVGIWQKINIQNNKIYSQINSDK